MTEARDILESNYLERSPLAKAMLAAWLNVTVEQLPNTPTYKGFPKAAAEAWERVGLAAIQYAKDNGDLVPTSL